MCACIGAIAVTGCTSSTPSATRAHPSVPPSLARPSTPHTKSSVVTGFIEPCVGKIRRTLTYAAGTVVALRGVERLRPVRPGEQKVILPTDVVARQHVNENGRYRFELAPGRYVLAATYDAGFAGRTFLDVSVPSGATLQRNLPDVCR